MRGAVLAMLFGICVVLFGCGQSEPTAEIFPTVPVTGVVIYNDMPLARHQVTFYPVDGQRPASAVTDEEGRFILGTNGPDDGAVVGVHKITVVAAPSINTVTPGQERPGMVPIPNSPIAAKYSNAETSGLSQTIREGGSTDIKIVVE